MNLQNLFGCRKILQIRGLLNTDHVAVGCRYHDKESDQWGCFYGERTDINPDAHHDYLSFLHVRGTAA